MKVANYSEFRKNLKSRLDDVTANNDLLVVHRQGGKSVVVMSLDEYNGIDETQYLLSTRANRQSLKKALEQFNKGQGQVKKLIDPQKAAA